MGRTHAGWEDLGNDRKKREDSGMQGHGGDIYGASLKVGGPVLDFSANLNPLGMPQGIRRALVEGLDACEHYPDPFCRELRAGIAKEEGVPGEWVLCGNGAADLIFRLSYALRPQRALMPSPTFSEYEQALRCAGCDIAFHPLKSKNRFLLQEDFLQYDLCGMDLVVLCNPNNPTGGLIPRELLERIARRCREEKCFLLLDECFVSLTDDPEGNTLSSCLLGNPYLILLKAFTKLYAMPGIRLGYALCSNRELLGQMEACAQSWSVSAPAQLAGIQALGEKEYRRQTRELLRKERAYLLKGLKELGVTAYGGEANFILFYLPDDRELADRMLRRHGIMIRDCRNFRTLENGGYYRIAVRTRQENEQLLQALAGEV